MSKKRSWQSFSVDIVPEGAPLLSDDIIPEQKVKEEIRRSLKERAERKRKASHTPPRYDEVFEKGVKWLDENS